MTLSPRLSCFLMTLYNDVEAGKPGDMSFLFHTGMLSQCHSQERVQPHLGFLSTVHPLN